MASGDSLCLFLPSAAEFPSTGYATPDIRDGILVLAFNDTVDESIEFAGFMPRHYDGGGITVTTIWMSEDQTSGTISWDISFKSFTDDVDVASKSFATAKNENATTASVSGEMDYAETPFTNGTEMDSILAGEYFRMLVTRDGNGTTSTDSLVNDMQLVAIEIRET